MFICIACSNKHKELTQVCPKCENFGTIIKTNFNQDFSDTEDDGISANQIHNMKFNLNTVPGFEFLGSLNKHLRIAIHGPEGSGKSTFSLKFADKLAEQGKTGYFPVEEGIKSATLAYKVRLSNAKNKNLKFYPDETKKTIIQRIKKNKVKNVFIDSMSEAKLKVDDITDIFKATPGFLYVISHTNKEGKYKGTTDLGHKVDIILKAFENKEGEKVVKNEKNRLSGTNETYKIFA